MKRFLLLFVLLAAVLLAVPGYIGSQAEERYQALINQFGQGGLQMAQNNYQRGWFSATASSQFKAVLPASQKGKPQKEIVFSLVSDISHGPLISSGLGLAEIISRIEINGETPFADDYKASIKTLVSLDGAGVTHIDLPAMALEKTDQRPAINFAGATGQVDFAANFDRVDTVAQMPGVKIVEGDSKLLEVGRISLSGSSKRSVEGLMLGGATFSIERIELKDSESGTQVSMDGLGVDVESSAQGEMVSAGARYHLKSINVNEQHYGPAEIKVGMSQLPAKVLGQIQKSVEEINAQQLSQAQRGMAMATLLLGSGPELLKADPRFDIGRLNVKTPQGLIDGQFSIQSVGLVWKEISDMTTVVEKLVAEAKLSMPEHFYRLAFAQKAQGDIMRQLEQRKLMGQETEVPNPLQLQRMAEQVAGQQLQQLLTQEFLIRDGNDLKVQASLEDGLLSVNGKTIPLPMGSP